MALGVLVLEQHRRTSQRSEKAVGELLIQSGGVVREATGTPAGKLSRAQAFPW